ncbi:hypothetical protein KIPB_012693, partial [Kipferlia bialata]|eukprot:g12693.t1
MLDDSGGRGRRSGRSSLRSALGSGSVSGSKGVQGKARVAMPKALRSAVAVSKRTRARYAEPLAIAPNATTVSSSSIARLLSQSSQKQSNPTPTPARRIRPKSFQLLERKFRALATLLS